MKKYVSAASAFLSHSRSLALTIPVALALVGPAQAAPVPPAVSASQGYCQLVKNTSARTKCLAGRQQFYEGNSRAGLLTMKQALQASPKEGVIRVVIAAIMSQLGDDGAAERELRQARTDGAPDQIVLHELFFTMLKLHKETLLLNEFSEPPPNAKGATPAMILDGRALALLSLKRFDEAASAMDRSLSLRRDASGLLDRARIANSQNNPALADKLITEALALEPQNSSALVAKLNQLESSNDVAATLAVSDRLLKLYPANNTARSARIKLYLKRNEDGKAKSEINAFLAVAPTAPVARFYQAVLLSRAHDKKGAVQIIQALPPNFVKTHPELAPQMAQIAFDNGNSASGIAILQDALSVSPDLVDVRLRLASQRLSDDSPQSALGVLGPVQDSPDPRVQKLLGQVRARIAKDRAF